jgi:hypothetical protein
MRTLILGETLVDLICERPVAAPGEADAFVPHFGGAGANVAVTAARAGADVALAGGAGDDDWGRWLQGRQGILLTDVSGHNESLSSPYHRERVARLRRQTHGDFTRAEMRRYRARLTTSGSSGQRASRTGH